MGSRGRGGRVGALRWLAAGAFAVAVTACSSDDDDAVGSTTPQTEATAASTAVGATPSSSIAGTAASTSSPAETDVASSPPSAGQDVVYTPGPCPDPVYPGVPALDLPANANCGVLTVPESRSAPTGRTIDLAVATLPSTSPDPAPDPLVYLTGGPGGSAFITATRLVADGWNADRDLIVFDQRGTWKSSPLLACREIDTFYSDLVGLDSFDPATRQRSADAVAACRDRISDEGWDRAAYNTTENAADVADLRLALGIEEWNLYGVSYGTDLALQTLRDHPEGIRSVVLDSVVPPQESAVERFWLSAANGYQTLFDDCAAEGACMTAYPGMAATFAEQVTSLTESPRTVTITDPATKAPLDVVIDGYKLANLVLTSSLAPGLIAPLPQMIDDLANGEGALVAERLAASVPPPGVTSYGLALGVFCEEHVPFTTEQEMADAALTALPDFPLPVVRLSPQSPYFFSDCAAWDVPTASESVRTPVASDVPVLILSGSLDAVTAPPNGETVAETLPNAIIVEFPDAAHDVMLWSPACGVEVMLSFHRDPTNLDDACVANLTPAPFTS